MKFLFVAQSNPAPGVSDEDVDKWYDEIHIPQLRAAIPGITAARRYEQAVHQQGSNVGHRLLTILEIESDDAEEILSALGQGLANGTIEQGTVLDFTESPPAGTLYHPRSAD